MGHKDKKNNTSFDICNKVAEKWTLKDATAIFKKVRDEAIGGARSIQGAILKAGLYSSGFYYLLEKYPVLESIKKDINDIIINTINEGGLDGVYNPALSIWRLKQLNETDKTEVVQTTRVIKVKTS